MIAYSNALRTATIDSEDTASGYPFANALTGRTSEQVGFLNGAARSVDFDCAAAVAVSALCIAHHNLGSVGGTIALYGSSDDAIYVPLVSHAAHDDGVIFLTFASASYRYYRLTILGHGGTAYIGDVFAGAYLSLPFGPSTGWTQPSQSYEDDLIANVTGRGAIAGISVVRQPKKASIQMRDFERSWFDVNWPPLISAMEQHPVYYLWNAGERAIYCVPTKIDPPKFTTPTRQSAQIDVIGLV